MFWFEQRTQILHGSGVDKILGLVGRLERIKVLDYPSIFINFTPYVPHPHTFISCWPCRSWMENLIFPSLFDLQKHLNASLYEFYYIFIHSLKEHI